MEPTNIPEYVEGDDSANAYFMMLHMQEEDENESHSRV